MMKTQIQFQFPERFVDHHQLGLIVHAFLWHPAEITERGNVIANQRVGIDGRLDTDTYNKRE